MKGDFAVPYMSDSQLVSSIRANKICPCYMFWGKDSATIAALTSKLINKLVPDSAKDLNYHFIPAAEFSSSQLSDICESLPVFSERVVAAINDLNAETLRQDELKRLNEIISEIDPSTTTLIIYATGVDLAEGKKQLSPKNKKLAEHISKCGGVVTEFAYHKPAELVKHIQNRMSKSGCFIKVRSAAYLAQLCGCDLLMVDNECDKLTAYTQSGEVTDQIIDMLVSGQTDADAYKLSRAVVSGKSAQAFDMLNSLYNRQAEPIPLLFVISSALMDLYRAKAAIISAKSESDMINDFSYKGRSFAAENAFRDCRSMSMDKIRRCLGILSDCDADMKSKRTDPKVLLEEAIAKMLSAK